MPARMSRGRGCRALLCAVLLSCRGESAPELSTQLPDGGAGDLETAEAWVRPGSELPSRPEVVALTNRLSIAAEAVASGAGEAAPRMRYLAGLLRERVWRLDHTATDAREALELYAQVAEGRDALSCEADRRRAGLAGELGGDAAASFREIYLATERQAAAEGGASEECLGQLRDMLARVESFRPQGASWHDLQREGARLATRHTTPAASASASDVSPPSGDGGFTGPELVVKPDAKLLGKETAKLTDIQPYSYPQGGRVVVHLSAPATYDTGILKPDENASRGHRIYLDLAGVEVKGKKHRSIDTQGFVSGVRMATHKDGVRIVLDLAEEAQRRIFYLPNPFRVVIDVGKRRAAPEPVPPSGGGKRTVRRVTLDPGHGGEDAGAVGPTGLQEKDVALDVAHRAAPALAAELGVETMLTRDTDVFVDLEERTARANAFQSDVFVSIHCNATENGEAEGHEFFILDPTREADRRAYGAIARENRQKGGALDPALLDAQLSQLAAGLQSRSLTKEGHLFAGLLRQATNASLGERYPGTHDHGVKTAGFYVLVGAQMPAVLFETAFISNTNDETRLSTADFRQKLADAIVNAIRAYRDGL
jgi:N-acetylmuramoyl-L-alanine amidase